MLKGISCIDLSGTLYLYPRIYLPTAAIEAVGKERKQPNMVYVLELLDKTGICIVPGRGFGQKEG
jgi:alanine transaminase